MLKVLNPGMYTTIQDNGRIGYRNIGVPVSGAMDSISANFANALLNNNKNDAVLEITMVGPKLLFMTATTFVISGAQMSAKINNNPILNYKTYNVNIGDILSFGKLISGALCYLAVSGGFQTTQVLKSRAFFPGITSHRRIEKNEILSFPLNKSRNIDFKGAVKFKDPFFETNTLAIFKGPDLDLFNTEEQKKLISNFYTISRHSNRMGYRLEEVIVQHSKSMITSPVLPGTVQLMPSGKLIVLMKDAQTTGGYPRIFQLTEISIAIMAQKREGDKIKFDLITDL